MRLQGKFYRALNPIFARNPLSGSGAALHGGRFNPRGVPAIYASFSVLTALREANQVGDLQPTIVVSYDADVEGVFDTRNAARLTSLVMDAASLADPAWRDRMKTMGKAPTQRLAEQLIGQGFNGLLVRSFAPGASQDDLNLVLWNWRQGAAPLCIHRRRRPAPPTRLTCPLHPS